MPLPPAKFIRIYSDIHLDFDIPSKNFKFDMLWEPEILETDKDTILIIAGDIWHANKPFNYCGQSWVKKIAKKFQYVLFILGNHDFWGGNFPKAYVDFKNNIIEQNLKNIFLLQDETLIIGNHKFIGGTLWTDFLNGSNECLYAAENGLMNDYKYIRFGDNYSKLRAKFLLAAHKKTKDYIFTQAKKEYSNQKIWVLTHHAPSYQSMDESDKRIDLKFENALYYSDYDSLIAESQIDYWIHGHSHHKKEYKINKTEIITNPRGYTHENSEYNPWFLKEL